MITATDIEARRIRSVRLLAPLTSDLAAWSLASARPYDLRHSFCSLLLYGVAP
jgi:hypothetical protein